MESPTWRANPDWGARVGYDAVALDRVNTAAIGLPGGCARVRRPAGRPHHRGDRPARRRDVAGESAPTPTRRRTTTRRRSTRWRGPGRTWSRRTRSPDPRRMGIVRAARSAGVPVLVGFTVETDGRLPDGTALREAVERVDARTRRTGSSSTAPTRRTSRRARRRRLAGPDRPGQPQRLHADPRRLDAAEEPRRGRPRPAHQLVRRPPALLPGLRVVGGCWHRRPARRGAGCRTRLTRGAARISSRISGGGSPAAATSSSRVGSRTSSTTARTNSGSGPPESWRLAATRRAVPTSASRRGARRDRR